MLPIEFARISRDGRLTLVTYPGTPTVQTYWALCNAETLSIARENLRLREGCGEKSIGTMIAESHSGAPEPEIEAAIYEWLQDRRELDAVIWTGLASNWLEKRGRPFSNEEAVCYLEEMVESKHVALERAREYVSNAPAQMQTQVRRLVRERLGWEDAALSNVLFAQNP